MGCRAAAGQDVTPGAREVSAAPIRPRFTSERYIIADNDHAIAVRGRCNGSMVPFILAIQDREFDQMTFDPCDVATSPDIRVKMSASAPSCLRPMP